MTDTEAMFMFRLGMMIRLLASRQGCQCSATYNVGDCPAGMAMKTE